MILNKKILLTGGGGFLGKHVFEALKEKIGAQKIFIARKKDYDLRKKEEVKKLFEDSKPEIVIHMAAEVGGLKHNKEHPGSVYYGNLMMNTNLIEEARKNNVQKFVAVGSAAAYPEKAGMPLKEKDFWEGKPEETIAPYALASKMMLVQAQTYRKEYGFNAIYLMPPNIYGPGDHFTKEKSHVIPATIKKFDEAKKTKQKTVEVWGGGKALREFVYVKDVARAIIKALEKYDSPEPLNVGSGEETTIKKLIETISELTNYEGEIFWDTTKPEGQLRRCVDSSRAKNEIGYEAKTNIDQGLKETVKWYYEQENKNKEE